MQSELLKQVKAYFMPFSSFPTQGPIFGWVCALPIDGL